MACVDTPVGGGHGDATVGDADDQAVMGDAGGPIDAESGPRDAGSSDATVPQETYLITVTLNGQAAVGVRLVQGGRF